eukprot:TRINITY_DN48270_c0_g1_i1.p3 TRINITY_DN48270_c0_g1~~TRINITY_DN48270_c0_g1_i1.p3  ORF type:complete len:120 (+),score=1.90 TRINITY_DN48270_c0_g1_i1:526-885(+)
MSDNDVKNEEYITLDGEFHSFYLRCIGCTYFPKPDKPRNIKQICIKAKDLHSDEWECPYFKEREHQILKYLTASALLTLPLQCSYRIDTLPLWVRSVAVFPASPQSATWYVQKECLNAL